MAIPRGEVVGFKILLQEVITPEIAKEMKEHANPNNRKLTNATVKAYANDMANGDWDPNAVNPIVFTKDGTLVEGHHRIEGGIESNTSFTAYVCEDAEPSFIYNLCLARTKNNILQMKGTEHVSHNNVAMINALGELIFGVTKVSVGEVERALLTDGFRINEINRIAQYGSSKALLRSTPFTCAMYCAYHCKAISFSDLEKFSRAVNTGFIDDMSQSSAIVLRNMILNKRIRCTPHAEKLNAFKCAQEAICDFATSKPRRLSYTGEKAWIADAFVRDFRNGTLFKEAQ